MGEGSALLPDFLSDLYPFRSRIVRIGDGPWRGRRLHFADHGDGPPVFFVHGNPTWSFLWRKVMSGLDGFRCVAPDLVGFGLSDKVPLGDHALQAHVDTLAWLVEELDLQEMILVGQDWGGPMVTALAARCPDRVAGVVLGNTSVLVPRRPRGTAFHRFSRLPVISDIVFRALGFPQVVLHRTQGDPQSMKGAVSRAYRWPLRTWGARAGPLALARMVPGDPDHPSLPVLSRGEEWIRGFDGPVSLIWGARDPILGRALERHVDALPQARVVRTEAGHFVQEEVPGEFVEAVKWCRESSRG